MLKLIATLSSIITLAPSAASVTYYSTVQGNNSVGIARSVLAQEILKNRIYGGQAKYSEFDGKTFYSEEALDEYLLQNHQVTSYLRSSNLNKIIKNYEYMTLDENKIYDTDLNNFKQLYCDAFGNTVDTRQAALDTYTNNLLVKAHYNYDCFYWFDTIKEAKINEKYKMNINKSLYYIYQNQYYNAFNKKDINFLISLMDEGYYANLNESLSHTL